MGFSFQNDSLGQGISQAGSALGQAIAFRQQQNQKKNQGTLLNKIIQEASIDPITGMPKQLSPQDYINIFSKAAQQGVSPEVLKPFTSILNPILKNQMQSQGFADFMSQYSPINKGSQTGGGGIATAKAMQQYQPELEQETIETPQGTLSTSEFIDIPGFGKVHPKMIADALSSPNPQVNKWGKGAQNALLGQQRINEKRFESDRNYHAQGTKEVDKRITGLREALPRKKAALSFARNAVESGDIGSFSQDALANWYGGAIGDALRTAKGSQLITASKENLLGNMARVSARGQNQWFEQRLNQMFPQIGQSREANLTIQEMLEADTAMEDAYLKKYDQLYDQDIKEFGFERRDLDKRAREAVAPLEEKIMRRANYRIKEIQEREEGRRKMRRSVGKAVVPGTPLTLTMAKFYLDRFQTPEKALAVAKKNGYYIPSTEEVKIHSMRPNDFMENNK